ncbi:papain-like cysteine protease family protein [Sinorhizobium sp. NFACC03]|uniref:papain-like cysteine protease family protein n=1 Tax=Sinorhizobium sp. NFACC03 TaxID=1566295 RepID=UPI000B85A1C6|nr:papain-like cysteine protease family protein [Sinorhizobium sp. NFACC03]
MAKNLILENGAIARRGVLLQGLGMAAYLGMPRSAAATEVCNASICDARIPSTQFRHQGQPVNSVWCWAATISMICDWHGRTISQQDIVQQCFGGIVNAPADPFTLISSVNRSYVDVNGDSFSVGSQIWSVLHGLAQLNNFGIIQQLSLDKPLVVCNLSHMMVLVGVSYPRGTYAITEAWVADPAFVGSVTQGIPGLAPLAPGFRYLYPAELVPVPLGGQLTFVAALDVS